MSTRDELIGQAELSGKLRKESDAQPDDKHEQQPSEKRGARSDQPVNWEKEATEQHSDDPAIPYGNPGRPKAPPETPDVSSFA